MTRRSKTTNRTNLSVTQLEDRCVPSGMIDVHHGEGALEIQGDNHANHVRVEWLGIQEGIRISSESGPVRLVNNRTGEIVITDEPVVLPRETNLSIHTENGADQIELTNESGIPSRQTPIYQWEETLIDSGNGDDWVIIDNLRIMSFDARTGQGDDQFFLNECTANLFHSFVAIDAGAGNDHVRIGGQTSLLLYIWLGNGDDVLEGDANSKMPDAGWTYVVAGNGYDQLLNLDYFHFGSPPFDFELID